MTSFSVPVPTDFRSVDDRFTSVYLGAPEFELLKKAVTYTITIEMMFESLRSGVQTISNRCKSDAALGLYARALDMLEAAQRLYIDGKKAQGSLTVQLAQCYFRQAGKPISKASEKKKEQWLIARLQENGVSI
jgi:hypothetical protein